MNKILTSTLTIKKYLQFIWMLEKVVCWVVELLEGCGFFACWYKERDFLQWMNRELESRNFEPSSPDFKTQIVFNYINDELVDLIIWFIFLSTKYHFFLVYFIQFIGKIVILVGWLNIGIDDIAFELIKMHCGMKGG